MEIVFLLANLRDFLEDFEQARKSSQTPLLRPKTEIGSTSSKDNLFAHCYNHLQEHSKSPMRFFWFWTK